MTDFSHAIAQMDKQERYQREHQCGLRPSECQDRDDFARAEPPPIEVSDEG